jgi:flap endonuclease-1
MGIKNLFKVLIDKTPNAIENINISQIKNKIVGIDTSIILYQYIIALKSTGKEFVDLNNKSTVHIMGILVKTLSYLKMNIIPVYVFDGKPSNLKLNLLNDRHKIKQNALNKLIELEKNNNYNNDDKIKLLKQSVSISHNEMLEAAEIVELLGVPYIFASEEADSQLAYLSKNNLIDYVVSEDMDILTFGSKNIIKKFGKKNMCIIHLKEIFKQGNITQEQFIDICILLGCDYTETINGIGYKKAWDIIKEYNTIDKLILNHKKIIESKYKLPDNFRYNEAREYFTNPRHIKVSKEELELKTPQLDKLKKLLINKYNFNKNNINNMIKFLNKSNDDIFLDD